MELALSVRHAAVHFHFRLLLPEEGLASILAKHLENVGAADYLSSHRIIVFYRRPLVRQNDFFALVHALVSAESYILATDASDDS